MHNNQTPQRPSHNQNQQFNRPPYAKHRCTNILNNKIIFLVNPLNSQLDRPQNFFLQTPKFLVVQKTSLTQRDRYLVINPSRCRQHPEIPLFNAHFRIKLLPQDQKISSQKNYSTKKTIFIALMSQVHRHRLIEAIITIIKNKEITTNNIHIITKQILTISSATTKIHKTPTMTLYKPPSTSIKIFH
jgi:hypothetical protein